MILKKRILPLLTVFIFAGISSGKKCYAPVLCNNGEYTETTWIEVSPPCQSGTNQLNNEAGNAAGQKGVKGEIGVDADLNMTALEKEIEAQTTANDVINTTIYDHQRAIKSFNESVKFMKEENKKEKSEKAEKKAEVVELKSKSVKMNETFTKQMSEFETKLIKLQKAARINEKDISDIQAFISSDGENSVTTLPNEKSTQADFTTTASRECEDGDIYYGGFCFWFNYTKGNITASESKCKSRNSTVGYILDEDHFNLLQNKLRLDMPIGQTGWGFWLGLQQDPSTGNVTIISSGLKAPFLKWGTHDPGRSSTETNIYLQVMKDATSDYNGMGDGEPWWSGAGVICQHKSL